MFEKIKKASIYISIFITILNAYTLFTYSDFSIATIIIFTSLKLYLLIKQYYIYVFWGLVVFYIYTSVFDLKKEAFTSDEAQREIYDKLMLINIEDISSDNLQGDNEEFISVLEDLQNAVTLQEKSKALHDIIMFIVEWYDIYKSYKSTDNTGYSESKEEEIYEQDTAFLQFLNHNGITQNDIELMERL
jgi:hypothetical protein